MPTPETLELFIARVEANAHDEAVEAFYAPNVSMQENQSEPRIGRDSAVARERAILARAVSIRSQCVRPVLVNGDHVAIRWIFEFEWPDGTVTHMEEIAWQRWEGERLAQETFFYDPAQRVPKPKTGA
ncbi:nuclear transport factor 2 family protein [Variovorax sp. J22G21]|uniref:nuclear transport factor 2 family protein n=1 Tax=Variovorax fucosicus TaxID=3053517 RepID=UPI002574D29F|nr:MULTISPECIES: nuclear transport factor 2 family protein [unclassified Variovorax]MDM0038645.1 nuclear transport factor 2 family protein [Variovorax sp. J22R193]MDM0055749.1 nuclear transport factor 2 family protein [Variovorax sp. J22G47]MDM0063421.1 nuclear transport factor 2 family protein [Variovorax sp. J22G21]